MDLDVEAKWWLKSGREGLDALSLCQRANVGQESLEPVLILGDKAGSLACHQFAQRIGLDRRPEAEVQQFREPPPRWSAFILLHLEVPHLGASLQVV